MDKIIKEKLATFFRDLCQGDEPPEIDIFDKTGIIAAQKLLDNGYYIDENNNLTLYGKIMGIKMALGLRSTLDVLVLAYVISGPANVSIDTFMEISYIHGVSDQSVRNAFSRLSKQKSFIQRDGRTVYSASSMGILATKQYKDLLKEIYMKMHRSFDNRNIKTIKEIEKETAK